MASHTAPRQRPRPVYADDLAESRAEAFRLLSRGVADRRSPLHTPVLGTVDNALLPTLRTVVLRAFDPERRVLHVHTDLRSAKHAHLVARPDVALLFYDPGHRIQLRVSGRASMHQDDALAEGAWAASQPTSLACYGIAASPGTPTPWPPPAPTLTPEARAHFLLIRIAFDRLEWLWLASDGHRRALFTWSDGALQSTWLVP